MSHGHRSDVLGRVTGMLVFLLGVGLLLFVFYHAYDLFTMKPTAALGLSLTGDPKRDPNVTAIGVQLAGLLIRVALLFLMSIAGSLVANKGINLYFSAMQGAPVGIPSKAMVTPPA